MSRREQGALRRAEAAGARYARDQINSEYFSQWVFDQLVEAAQRPEEMIPLETRDDAIEVARRMLQQLEWDTKRDLDLGDLNLDVDGLSNRAVADAFYAGFRNATQGARKRLAGELLRVKKQIGSRTTEAPKAVRSARRTLRSPTSSARSSKRSPKRTARRQG